MLRVLLISLFLLAIPFIAYALYCRFVQAGEEKGADIWQDAPVVQLAIVGVVLAIVGLVGLVQLTGMD